MCAWNKCHNNSRFIWSWHQRFMCVLLHHKWTQCHINREELRSTLNFPCFVLTQYNWSHCKYDIFILQTERTTTKQLNTINSFLLRPSQWQQQVTRETPKQLKRQCAENLKDCQCNNKNEMPLSTQHNDQETISLKSIDVIEMALGKCILIDCENNSQSESYNAIAYQISIFEMFWFFSVIIPKSCCLP